KRVGTTTLTSDKPRAKPRCAKAVPPEECQETRMQLQGGPETPAWSDLSRLDRAGHLAVCNLYDRQDTEPITAFRETEAQKLLEHMVWDHSHEDHYITETTVDGERQRATWKTEFSTPDLLAHLAADRY